MKSKEQNTPSPETKRVISYLRVSTSEQGKDGLGIEAQRALISRVISERGLLLVREFVEVRSGSDNHRPLLQEALALARSLKIALIVAKQDRLSRDASYAIGLLSGQTEIIVADSPHDYAMVRNMKAVFAQEERERIGQRTREALAQLKSRLALLKPKEHLTSKSGKRFRKLGSPTLNEEVQTKGGEARALKSNEFALSLRPILSDIINNGKVTTPAKIALALNARGVSLANKHKASALWHHGGVRNVLLRLERLGQGIEQSA